MRPGIPGRTRCVEARMRASDRFGDEPHSTDTGRRRHRYSHDEHRAHHDVEDETWPLWTQVNRIVVHVRCEQPRHSTARANPVRHRTRQSRPRGDSRDLRPARRLGTFARSLLIDAFGSIADSSATVGGCNEGRRLRALRVTRRSSAP